jgi:hypothetical protein
MNVTQYGSLCFIADNEVSNLQENCAVNSKRTGTVRTFVFQGKLRFMMGVSQIILQWHSKCYSVTSITKMFTPKGVQTIHLFEMLKMGRSYAPKCKCFRNAHHTATIPL